MKSGFDIKAFSLLFLASTCFAQTGAPTPTPVNSVLAAPLPAYQVRGDQVDKRYREYTERLKKDYDDFREALKMDAPDLFKKLLGTPPKPVEYGYQIVPKVDMKLPVNTSKDIPRAVSVPYSWLRTDQFIDWEINRIKDFEDKLKAVALYPATERRPLYEKMVADYPMFDTNQKTIDAHVSYNRLWQAAIANDKARFTRLTELHDEVVERQTILDKLKTASDPALVEKEKQLAKDIHSQNDDIKSPSFIKVKHPKANVWILEVPIYTDIKDKKFLQNFREGVEKIWHVEDKDQVYRMKVILKNISAAKLYKDKTPPKDGEHIDVDAHANRFPRDGGVLTTGTVSTFAIPGHYVALGPGDTSITVLAHEFGHILGFVDGYFRGFRDRGDEGYEVLEIVPDPDDLMCTPGAGHIHKFHFETLIRALTHKRAAPSSSVSTSKPAP